MLTFHFSPSRGLAPNRGYKPQRVFSITLKLSAATTKIQLQPVASYGKLPLGFEINHREQLEYNFILSTGADPSAGVFL
jgi:hypothetical protein